MIRKDFILAVFLYLVIIVGILYREQSHVNALEYTAKFAKKMVFSAHFLSCMESLSAFQVIEPGVKDFCALNAFNFVNEALPDENEN
jgi:hypothetical protein